ncbi:Protein FecR [Pseudomonas sp. Teo4]|nr:Protein FecR [Pseudomonas sp. Teo4]
MSANGLGQITPVPAGADAWTRGMLVVDNVRLADLLAELGQYRNGHLGVDDEVANLRVTGSFPLNDTDLALASLVPALPVKIERHTPWWVTVKAK